MTEGMGWIVETDVRGYCDSIDGSRLREVLWKRVNDGRRMRLSGKWLRAGVREDGTLTHPETGVPQGGVVSPVLAHGSLHAALALWCDKVVKAHWRGEARLSR